MSLTNAIGGRYSIQRSTNLASWSAADILALSATNSGSLIVTNDRPNAIYRAVALRDAKVHPVFKPSPGQRSPCPFHDAMTLRHMKRSFVHVAIFLAGSLSAAAQDWHRDEDPYLVVMNINTMTFAARSFPAWNSFDFLLMDASGATNLLLDTTSTRSFFRIR